MKTILGTTILFCSLFTATTFAAPISVVDSQSCQKMKNTDSAFILALKKGEEISQSILKCVNDAKLPGASLSGVGALENPTLAYYNMEKKDYDKKTFTGLFELVSLNGTITSAESNRDMNIHVALADDVYHMIGGHLDNSNVGVIANITVIPFKGKVNEKMDDEIGFKVLTSK